MRPAFGQSPSIARKRRTLSQWRSASSSASCSTPQTETFPVKVLILTGTDPAFSAGVDFKDMDPAFDPRDRRFTVNPGRALRAMRTPVICAVNGPCISGGLEIALSSSFIVASDRAIFADTHARLNVLPVWGLTGLLPRVVGIRKAREMSLTGDQVNALEAFRLGMREPRRSP